MDTEKLLLRVKKDVRSLLISSKHGLSPEQLRKDYQNMLGHPIPLRALGFRSVLDMVKEMSDAVYLYFNLDGTIVLKAIGNETTRGIEELVSKQRNHKHKPKPKSGGTGLFSSHSHHQHSFVLARRGHAPPALHAQLRSQLRQVLAHGPVGLSDLERCYAIHFGKPLNVMHYGFYSIAEMLAAASDMITVKQTRMGSQLILKTEITTVKQKLNSTAALPKQSAGISRLSTSSVLQETALFSNVQPEDQQKSKQTSSASRVQEIEPATIEMQEKSFEKSVAKLEEQFRKRILENSEAGTVSQELKDKLRKVVAKHTQGIAIHKLPTEYKKMYGEDLPVAQCGFLSITEMVETLSDTFCVQPSTEDGAEGIHIMVLKPHVQPAVSMNPSTEGHYFSCSETAWECQDDRGESMESLDSNPEIKTTNKIIHQTGNIFPVTVLSRGSVIPLDALLCQKLKPPTRRRYRDLVPVVVERIESPSHFYIRSDEDHRILENMMFEMRSCYFCPEVAERYQLPDAYVRPGQVCCVAPRDMWFYRVVIHRLLSATEVEVYYADFGDLSVVNRNKLKFLKSCYADLPAQAVPSILVGVRPVKTSWSKEATSLFQKMCHERTLVAVVHSYRRDFLLLFLCDTNTEEDIYIHSALQTEGHAVACATDNTLVLEQFNPVTLYLGDSQLEEVKEHFAAVTSSSVTNGQNLTHLQPNASTVLSQHLTGAQENQKGEMAFLDLPELEFIDEDQGENSIPFESLLKKDPECFVNWDEGWTNMASVDEESKRLQNGKGESAKTAFLSPVPFIKPDLETQAVLESKPTLKPALSLHTLLDQTPGMIPSCRDHTDMCAELFQTSPSSALIFPMFSSGDRRAQDSLFLRHTSPLAQGPSARMAAGPSLPYWYKERGLNKLAASTHVCIH
ncbi:tudor domain-containing protein 5 isoform X1 [Tachysurus vachellii]|uniref:tudor domain-containing protein 5 isoform X1 n=1 Tax=Tachysurus vachellii TaxID=175792 RepID=UPI00296AEBB1|nr:tudor domain-containing protein 5 isoform X1 [Tachysurus vachellii]XP_060720505.1 tudor domain-containing protein 5 isoform X1 [Tachysurus vachellii]XP_060720514.1 tudor domain-containing protein 5 isoform X1 [Tachysurus vachellii]